MTSLRKLSLLSLALCLGACRDEKLSGTASELLVRPERVNFGQVWAGARNVTTVELQNAARQPLDVTLSIEAPFEIDAARRVGGGELVPLELRFTAPRAGRFVGTLLVTWGANTREIAVEGLAVTPPACPSADCRDFTFDPSVGACVETVRPDGASCGEHNQCLTGGVCRAGECLGLSRDCSDGDTCTTDACDPAVGCVHEAVACPGSSNPCEVPVCNAATGCGLTPALDGVSCGSNDCVTAHVCIGGQCVTRAAPDGSECAQPTVCRGSGLCRAQVCETPAPHLLSPRWRYTPEAGHTVTFLGQVDELGNLYATETWVGTPSLVATQNQPMQGAAEDRAGVPVAPPQDVPIVALLSLTPTGVVRFRQQVTTECPGCVYGLWFVVDSAGHRVFFNAKGQLQARSTDDGRLLWDATPSDGIIAFDPRSDGGAVFSTSAPLLIGDDVVGVPVMEGNSDHHAYVRAFDRQSGAVRWQFHRKGHLYGTGVAANGELWTSSANCWAVAGEMARVSPAGVERQVRFVEWIPAIYGDDFAIGTTGGKLHQLDATLNLRDLTTLTSASGAAWPLVTGEQLVLWDAPARALRSVNLNSGVTAFTFTRLTAPSPDFELLRDGGVAWTSTVPDGGVIGAVNGRGEELLSCPLPTTVDSSTAIVRGRAVMQSGDSIVAYDVPGLDVEPRGWVTRFGSPGRGNRAR